MNPYDSVCFYADEFDRNPFALEGQDVFYYGLLSFMFAFVTGLNL